eukprot:PhF_6_TR14253/c1_g1_i1/m.22888/K03035/PSMD12, RPN5; 26S proteasome regulatory subunit N5
MADEGIVDKEWKCASWKKEQDHATEATELLTRCNRTVPTNRATAEPLVDEILNLEKTARLHGDIDSTKRLAVEVVAIYRVLKEYEVMIDMLQLILRRRGQAPQVQTACVKEATEGVTSMSSTGTENRKRLMTCIERIRECTEGRLHVELEYGRLSVLLATMHEEDGDITTSCNILQHIQVETMTSMSRQEKLKVLVHHIQLCMQLKDYTRAAIMSRKIGARAIAADDARTLRDQYFRLMIEYYTHLQSYHHIAMCWWELFTCHNQTDADMLRNAILYLILAPPATPKDVSEGAECTAFSAVVKEVVRVDWLKKLSQVPIIADTQLPQLIEVFTGPEWIQADVFTSQFSWFLNADAVKPHTLLIKQRLVEHNLLIISKHYTRCRLSKVSQLVSLSQSEVEAVIMNLVSMAMMYAKIDRVKGIVVFRQPSQGVKDMEEWSQGIDKVMKLLNETCHLIQKERMTIPVTAS